MHAATPMFMQINLVSEGLHTSNTHGYGIHISAMHRREQWMVRLQAANVYLPVCRQVEGGDALKDTPVRHPPRPEAEGR